MGINASNVKHSGGNTGPAQDPIDVGNYPARLVQVIDLGLQPQRPYQGQEKPPAHMLFTTYELTDEFMKDEDGKDIEDKPRWLSEDFPLHSLKSDRARSTQRYNVLDPDCANGGDWGELLTTPCMVTVTQSEGKGKNAGKVYNNIGGTSPMRAKDAERTPELVNPPKVFDLDQPDIEIFKSLPEWLQDKIKGNLEYKGSPLDLKLSGSVTEAPAANDETFDDEVPW